MKWHNSSQVIADALVKAPGRYRELTKLLDVSRTFIDNMIKGKKPIPARILVLLDQAGFACLKGGVKAHMEDLKAVYSAEIECYQKQDAAH